MTFSTAKLADVEARRRILTDFGTTLFVEAAAGTGKTTVLVGRIVALICEGVSTLDRFRPPRSQEFVDKRQSTGRPPCTKARPLWHASSSIFVGTP
jgi:hypothetical protein